MREVRMALLEADVNFQVVKDFIARVTEKSVGLEVTKALSPGQQIIKIVHEELVTFLGTSTEQIQLDGRQPVIIMMAGLQGSGKTTSSGKLAAMLKGKGRKPYLVPADIYRPAAIEQLQVLGGQIEVPVHPSTPDTKPVDICRQAVNEAAVKGYDTLIRQPKDQYLHNPVNPFRELNSWWRVPEVHDKWSNVAPTGGEYPEVWKDIQ